jgi:hypothetical protein
MKYAKGTLGLFFIILIVGTGMNAFGFLGFGNTLTWQEEVKLLDGRVITVTQKRRYESAYNGHNVGNIPREVWVTFKLPEFGEKEIVWHEKLKPHVLNLYQGGLYLVATPPSGREFIQYGSPKPGYVQFKYDGIKWQRIGFNEIPEAVYDTNMLTANAPGSGGRVSLADKIEEMKNDRIPNSEKRLDPNWIID